MMQHPSSAWSRWAPPAVRNLIVINFIIWIASMVLLRRGIDVNDLLGLHYFSAPKFSFVQFFTYMFLHSTSSIEHVFSNMFALWIFGSTIEQVWGAKRFLLFYIVSGLSAALMQELSWMYELGDLSGYELIRTEAGLYSTKDFLDLLVTVGASGSVFGILLAFGILFPNAYVFVGFFIPMKAKYFVFLYGALELYLGVHNTGGGVAHFAHLGGMIGGLILILLWRKKGEISQQNY